MSDKIWCQNPKCPNKQTRTQIRGIKGHKYYQSKRASEGYFGIACCQGCLYDWIRDNKDAFINVAGRIIKPVKLTPESSWKKNYKYNYKHETRGTRYTHYLENILLGEKISITEAQYDSLGWENSSDKATTLANSLRAKQSA